MYVKVLRSKALLDDAASSGYAHVQGFRGATPAGLVSFSVRPGHSGICFLCTSAQAICTKPLRISSQSRDRISKLRLQRFASRAISTEQSGLLCGGLLHAHRYCNYQVLGSRSARVAHHSAWAPARPVQRTELRCRKCSAICVAQQVRFAQPLAPALFFAILCELCIDKRPPHTCFQDPFLLHMLLKRRWSDFSATVCAWLQARASALGYPSLARCLWA